MSTLVAIWDTNGNNMEWAVCGSSFWSPTQEVTSDKGCQKDRLGKSLTSREHASGYMRCPCKGHKMGCLWLLLWSPKQEVTNDEIHRHAKCHFKQPQPVIQSSCQISGTSPITTTLSISNVAKLGPAIPSPVAMAKSLITQPTKKCIHQSFQRQ